MQFDECIVSKKEHKDPTLQDPSKYERLVGRLLHLTMNRPNLSFLVHGLIHYMFSPKESHMEATFRVVRHIKEDLGLGLFFAAEDTN